MKKDNWDDLENKYFSGDTSSEEEKHLKNRDNDYFNTLRSEKEKSMDLSFDEFINEAEDKEITPLIVSISSYKMWKKYIRIAAVLIGLCATTYFFILKNEKAVPHSEIAQKNVIPNKNIIKSTDTITILSQKNTIVAHNTNKKIKKSFNLLSVQHRKAIRQSFAKNDVPESDSASAYQPRFVIVNGKPIYDEEEAINMTKASLNLLVNNIELVQNNVSVIKKLSINL